MCPPRLLALYFSPFVLAAVLLDGYSIAHKSAEGGSTILATSCAATVAAARCDETA